MPWTYGLWRNNDPFTKTSCTSQFHMQHTFAPVKSMKFRVRNDFRSFHSNSFTMRLIIIFFSTLFSFAGVEFGLLQSCSCSRKCIKMREKEMQREGDGEEKNEWEMHTFSNVSYSLVVLHCRERLFYQKKMWNCCDRDRETVRAREIRSKY